MCVLDDLAEVPREEWSAMRVGEVTRTDVVAPGTEATLRDAVAALESSDLDLVPVVDRAGAFVGTVSWGDLLELDEILSQTSDDRPGSEPS
jgi:CBS domain-containing protein